MGDIRPPSDAWLYGWALGGAVADAVGYVPAFAVAAGCVLVALGMVLRDGDRPAEQSADASAN